MLAKKPVLKKVYTLAGDNETTFVVHHQLSYFFSFVDFFFVMETCCFSFSYYFIKGDASLFGTKIFHDRVGGRNVSASGLTCLACNAPHSFMDKIDSGKPVVVFFGRTQSISPGLSVSGSWLKSKAKSRTFFRLCWFRTGKFLVGSVVLIGSLSRTGQLLAG